MLMTHFFLCDNPRCKTVSWFDRDVQAPPLKTTYLPCPRCEKPTRYAERFASYKEEEFDRFRREGYKNIMRI